MGTIRDNVRRILSEIPQGVSVVAAAKTRNALEIREAIDAGLMIMGENYLQESVGVIGEVGSAACWHFIGHVQKNKAKHIVPLFDMIQTVDSIELARVIDRQCEKHSKLMPILIEVNIAEEQQKSGVMPGDVSALVEEIRALKNIRMDGLMTMGPQVADPEGLRPYYRDAKILFDEIRDAYSDTYEIGCLSMGMSASYRIAIEEGASMVRIGTGIFGPRSGYGADGC